MPQQANDIARRVGIWTVAALALGAGLYAAIQFVPDAPGAGPAGSVAAVTTEDHVIGSGPVELIEYSDFQCPACKSYQPMVKRLIAERGDSVTFVYRHFPLATIHRNATVAAEAAEAAALQGKFWEMHDRLFDGQSSWDTDRNPELVFESYARDLGLDVDRFKSDLASSAVKDRVTRDVTSGNTANVQGTPTFFLNGARLDNARSYEDFRSAIDSAIGAQSGAAPSSDEQ